MKYIDTLPAPTLFKIGTYATGMRATEKGTRCAEPCCLGLQHTQVSQSKRVSGYKYGFTAFQPDEDGRYAIYKTRVVTYKQTFEYASDYSDETSSSSSSSKKSKTTKQTTTQNLIDLRFNRTYVTSGSASVTGSDLTESSYESYYCCGECCDGTKPECEETNACCHTSCDCTYKSSSSVSISGNGTYEKEKCTFTVTNTIKWSSGGCPDTNSGTANTTESITFRGALGGGDKIESKTVRTKHQVVTWESEDGNASSTTTTTITETLSNEFSDSELRGLLTSMLNSVAYPTTVKGILDMFFNYSAPRYLFDYADQAAYDAACQYAASQMDATIKSLTNSKQYYEDTTMPTYEQTAQTRATELSKANALEALKREVMLASKQNLCDVEIQEIRLALANGQTFNPLKNANYIAANNTYQTDKTAWNNSLRALSGCRSRLRIANDALEASKDTLEVMKLNLAEAQKRKAQRLAGDAEIYVTYSTGENSQAYNLSTGNNCSLTKVRYKLKADVSLFYNDDTTYRADWQEITTSYLLGVAEETDPTATTQVDFEESFMSAITRAEDDKEIIETNWYDMIASAQERVTVANPYQRSTLAIYEMWSQGADNYRVGFYAYEKNGTDPLVVYKKETFSGSDQGCPSDDLDPRDFSDWHGYVWNTDNPDYPYWKYIPIENQDVKDAFNYSNFPDVSYTPQSGVRLRCDKETQPIIKTATRRKYEKECSCNGTPYTATFERILSEPWGSGELKTQGDGLIVNEPIPEWIYENTYNPETDEYEDTSHWSSIAWTNENENFYEKAYGKISYPYAINFMSPDGNLYSKKRIAFRLFLQPSKTWAGSYTEYCSYTENRMDLLTGITTQEVKQVTFFKPENSGFKAYPEVAQEPALALNGFIILEAAENQIAWIDNLRGMVRAGYQGGSIFGSENECPDFTQP